MGTEFMIYLDTHVILWLFARKGEGLSVHAMNLIENDTQIVISPMVLLELEYLHEIGRTTLGSKPVYDYLHERIGLQLCKHSFTDVIQMAAKQTWTRDPFDRIITAQAAIDSNALVTKDSGIRKHYQYAVW
jgi:PIN domain nuclease of toxin-antitoxin system